MAAILHNLPWAKQLTTPQPRALPIICVFCIYINDLLGKRQIVTGITSLFESQRYQFRRTGLAILAGCPNGSFASARWAAAGRSDAVDKLHRQTGHPAEDDGIIGWICGLTFGRRLLSAREFVQSTMDLGVSGAVLAVRRRLLYRLPLIFEPNLGPSILTGTQGE